MLDAAAVEKEHAALVFRLRIRFHHAAPVVAALKSIGFANTALSAALALSAGASAPIVAVDTNHATESSELDFLRNK